MLGNSKRVAGKATPSGSLEAEHRGIFPATARVRRGSPIAMLICLLASSCSQTDSPEGLGEALAAVEATRKMQDCRARMNETAGQMKMMGAVNGAVGTAGAVRGKLSRQMQSC
ncbi:hypothetical protein EN904_18540 [Mesorhizobium sp. M7A.F.Ca.CA.001.07.2.1]|uniref:hypothetical protein n=2 Tax=Phyllobacteriaceae TaxID=69277 RepID=UPI000FCBC36D|nr:MULTISPECIES: hypothetical protein [Mesorhizobium]RUY24676.1 hypothetical protein EN984_15430 [Mesorhizobium sp. M7A.F.Ca.CA.004.12.1.1]RUY92608.1 hypothetical protein EN964_03490 [Mesorhizobium sp. M7A.F.Ca.CA.001.10.2.1]RUZ53855.1 hypothetical protein EN956_16965 [Mesorhizobium sp. M7A.F.Ca.CA.004.05.2.1]RVA18904.1 hypothetical protein EN939_05195 [Mesorhizobium sp. M7A.F.Ca.CA.002.05.1.1]RVA57970.1 hypothetical protein EN920_16275 [Mesorhizobium sp. M7A.F.Ca.CA.004.09.1.2]RVA91075.1 hyp